MNKTLEWIMGIYEDKREPSTVHFPSACQCPVKSCDDRGTYTNCYLPERFDKCHIYKSSEHGGEHGKT